MGLLCIQQTVWTVSPPTPRPPAPAQIWFCMCVCVFVYISVLDDVCLQRNGANKPKGVRPIYPTPPSVLTPLHTCVLDWGLHSNHVSPPLPHCASRFSHFCLPKRLRGRPCTVFVDASHHITLHPTLAGVKEERGQRDTC